MDSLLTVVTPASGGTPPQSPFDLTTIADVKADLDITGVDAPRDVILQRYVTESSLELAGACNRVFARETVSELYRPVETKRALILTRRPLASITTVHEDGDLVAAADYEADVEAGLLYRLESDYRAAWCAPKIVVVYVAGYAFGAAPSDLQKAARAMVKAQWLSKGRDPLVRSESVPGVYEVAYWVGGLPGGAALSSDIKSALDRYSNPLV